MILNTLLKSALYNIKLNVIHFTSCFNDLLSCFKEIHYFDVLTNIQAHVKYMIILMFNHSKCIELFGNTFNVFLYIKWQLHNSYNINYF